MENLNQISELSLKNRLLFLIKDSALYGGAAALTKASALITFPILAQHYTVQEYGVIDYFNVLGTFLSIFIIFGQDSAIVRYFFEYEDKDTRQQLISQSLLFQLSILTLFLPLLWLNAEWLLGISNDQVFLFKIVLLHAPCLVLINFVQNLLKWTFARTLFLTMSLGYTVLQTSLLVVAVLVFDVGVAGVLMVTLATSMIFCIAGLFLIRNWLACPRDFSRIREMLPFAVPFGVICVASSVSPTLERTLTLNLLGTDSLGLYAAGTKFAMIIGIFVGAFQIAWGPFSMSLHKNMNAFHTFNWVFKLFALMACIATLTITLIAQPLISLMANDHYLDAVVVVFPLAMGLSIHATSWITGLGINISKQSHLHIFSYSAGILVTLGGIFILAPIFGLLGVGLGVLFGTITNFLVTSWLAQKVYPLPWQYLPVAILITVTMLSGLLSIWAEEHFGMLLRNLLLGGTMLLIIGIGWIALFSQSERILLKEFFMRKMNSIF